MEPFKERIQSERRQNALQIRNLVETGIRVFFGNQGFIETKTPLLVKTPATETHLRTFKIDHHEAYLPTSPEISMKKLLAGGLERIFQIAPCFRDEPISNTHLPEFTMCEWYRAHSDWLEIMKDTEELFQFLAENIYGTSLIEYQEQKIDLSTPWQRVKINDLFKEHVGIDLKQMQKRDDLALSCQKLGIRFQKEDSWDDLYFRIWLDHIEPKLPKDRPVIVTHYPKSQSALSNLEKDETGFEWAKRFEVYVGGLELANAFDELTDPNMNRSRFESDMNLRKNLYSGQLSDHPYDPEFDQALREGIPASGGIALGVDRLVMLLANEPDIRNTVWLY